MILGELSRWTGLFEKKDLPDPATTYPVWDYPSTKSAEKPKTDGERLQLLKSSREKENCIKTLSQQFLNDSERHVAYKEIPPAVVKKIVSATFEIYQTLILLESGKANFEVFVTQLNTLHQLINEQPYNSYQGVLRPARKHLEHILQFTLAEKTVIQKHFFDALLSSAPVKRTIEHGRYLGDDVIEFQSPVHSQVDTQLLTAQMREQDFSEAVSFEEVLLRRDWLPSMVPDEIQNLPPAEQKKFIDFMTLASPSFKSTDQTLEQLRSNNADIYHAELNLFLLQNRPEPLLKAKAAQGLLRQISLREKLVYSPKLPRALETKIESALVSFLISTYITELPEESKKHYFWLKQIFGMDFLKHDFLPYLIKHLDLTFPDLLGMMHVTKLIAAYRNESAELKGLQSSTKAAEFLVFCVSVLEGKRIDATLLDKKALQEINAPARDKADLVIFSSTTPENQEAINWCAKTLLETMKAVPLTQATYTELAGLWVKNKNSEDKTPYMNIMRNLLKMQLLEATQPGSVESLLLSPCNIRFFDRYNPEDLLCMLAKIKLLQENKPGSETERYDPKKTIIDTTALHDHNDAFYDKHRTQFHAEARKRGFDVIMIEIDSPAQLFRSLEALFLLNNSQPFAATWVLHAHGGSDGGICLGSVGEPASHFLPSAVDTIMTQNMQIWFGTDAIQLFLSSCYSGIHWVKQMGNKLKWFVDGQEGIAGLVLRFDTANLENHTIESKAMNHLGETLPKVQFNPKTQTSNVVY